MEEEYIADLFAAYGNIPIKYSNKSVIHSQRQVEPTTQQIERVFSAELYHQLRKIMDIKENRYIDLILHTEIGKLINNNTVQHPDMVLHGGQIGPNRENNNKIFLELKMDEFDNADFEKIYYALENLNYKYGVYIIHNMGINEIRSVFDRIRNGYPNLNNYLSRIYFMNAKNGVFNLNYLNNR